MKRLFIALAAVAAMVGCSREVATNNNITQHKTFALNASIVTDDTRVTIGGEKFTEVSWVEGDNIRLESEAGRYKFYASIKDYQVDHQP